MNREKNGDVIKKISKVSGSVATTFLNTKIGDLRAKFLMLRT